MIKNQIPLVKNDPQVAIFGLQEIYPMGTNISGTLGIYSYFISVNFDDISRTKSFINTVTNFSNTEFPFLYLDVVKHQTILHSFRFDLSLNRKEFPFVYTPPYDFHGNFF